MRIFNRDIHLPSGVKEWHIPEAAVEPREPFWDFLFDPEEEQDTSYLAASLKILNLLFISKRFTFFIYIIYEQTFVVNIS